MGKRSLILRDNGGATFDRYTLVIQERQNFYFFSFSVDQSKTFGIDHYHGSSWDGLQDGPHWGKVIDPGEVPREVFEVMFKRYCEFRDRIVTEMKHKIKIIEEIPIMERTHVELTEYEELLEELKYLAAA